MKHKGAEILICRDMSDISRRAAELFVELAVGVVEKGNRFSVVLSGGSTPRALYTLLASHPYCERIHWASVRLFWGDERCVSADHPDSNYRMAREAWIEHSPIPDENVHRIRAEMENHELAAEQYENEIRQFFLLSLKEWPRFDLVLLGMGEDGHTASLFPQTRAVQESSRLVVANYVDQLGSFRITMTAPAINHADTVVFLVSGHSKAGALREIIEGKHRPQLYPAQLIRPSNGKLLFLVDEAAAGQLTRIDSN